MVKRGKRGEEEKGLEEGGEVEIENGSCFLGNERETVRIERERWANPAFPTRCLFLIRGRGRRQSLLFWGDILGTVSVSQALLI